MSGDQAAEPLTQIRTSRVALLAVAVLAIGMIPLATASPWLLVLFVVPVVAAVAVVRVGVDVSTTRLTAHGLLGSRRLDWDDVAGLRAGRRGELHAVLRDGGEIRLPITRARHLPVLAAASGGRITDPTSTP